MNTKKEIKDCKCPSRLSENGYFKVHNELCSPTKQSEPKQVICTACGRMYDLPLNRKQCICGEKFYCKPLEQKCNYASSYSSTKCVVSGCKNKMHKSCFCKKHQLVQSKSLGWEEDFVKEVYDKAFDFGTGGVGGTGIIKAMEQEKKYFIKKLHNLLASQQHDHEILVNTIISTKNNELKARDDTAYAKGICKGREQIISAVRRWAKGKKVTKEKLREFLNDI